MRDDLNLKILSPEKIAFTGTINSVHVPAALGELEIFLNHASLVSFLFPGFITVRHLGGKADKYFISGGYIEVHGNEVSLIVDDIIDTANATSDYFEKQITVLSQKLKNNTLSDDEYEKTTQSVALYQQYVAY